MNRVIIYPYKMGSQSAKLLQQGLREVGHKVTRVRPVGTYRDRPDDYIINWGNSTVPQTWSLFNRHIINRQGCVGLAANKLHSFNTLHRYRVSIPAFSTDKSFVANVWREGTKVFCRTLLTGHSGRGIVVASQPSELVSAPLYVQEFKKQREYRVHIFKGEVLDVQEKRRRTEAGSRYDCDVWNYGNDFIYARENINIPDIIIEQSKAAISALGLDFGAVDIGYDHRGNSCAVFEVNTAPGLTGTTLNRYIEAFSNDIRQYRN